MCCSVNFHFAKRNGTQAVPYEHRRQMTDDGYQRCVNNDFARRGRCPSSSRKYSSYQNGMSRTPSPTIQAILIPSCWGRRQTDGRRQTSDDVAIMISRVGVIHESPANTKGMSSFYCFTRISLREDLRSWRCPCKQTRAYSLNANWSPTALLHHIFSLYWSGAGSLQ